MKQAESQKKWTDLIPNWINVRQAHEALQVAKDARRAQIVNRLVLKTQDGTVGCPGDYPIEDEDVGVQIGDNVVHHHHTPTKSRMGTLGKLATVGALMAGTGGLGAAIPIVASLLSQQGTAMTDTDTQYELKLVVPGDDE
jgi:hypothetical protein